MGGGSGSVGQDFNVPIFARKWHWAGKGVKSILGKAANSGENRKKRRVERARDRRLLWQIMNDC